MAPRTSKPKSGKGTPAIRIDKIRPRVKKPAGKETPSKESAEVTSAKKPAGKGTPAKKSTSAGKVIGVAAKGKKITANVPEEQAVMAKHARKRKSEVPPEESEHGGGRGPSKKLKAEEGNRIELQASPRNKKGELVFEGFPNFRPNMTPKEVLHAGSFGGTYYRPIYSGVTKQKYKDAWKDLPKNWLEGLDILTQVASSLYREEVNTYKVKCGGSLDMWESSGWITPQDPYGWFQWYCRFFQGRRTADDLRQIGRWDRCTGVTGRWRGNLISKIVQSGCAYDNMTVSPVVRQTLQHWAYCLTPQDYEQGAKKARKRLK